MSEAEFKAAKWLGPVGTVRTGNSAKNGIAVVTAGVASAATDLSAAAELGTDFTAKMVTLVVDAGGVFYRWDSAAGTADPAATSGANRVHYLPPGETRREQPTGNFIVYIRNGGADVRLRIATSSP